MAIPPHAAGRRRPRVQAGGPAQAAPDEPARPGVLSDAGAFYGRRKGKRLRPAQSDRLQRLLPALALDLGRPAPAVLSELFPVPVDVVRLEIGFGGAEHLLHEAAAHPGAGFIGVEPFVNGMVKALAGIEAGKLANVRLSDVDAVGLLDWLPAGSLGGVDLLYPDPWPKRRQWKRRFVSDVNVARLARVIQPGGTLRFATDIDSYVEWTLMHLGRSREFVWTATRADDWRTPWQGWPGTRYEAKAQREGRRPTYLTFRHT